MNRRLLLGTAVLAALPGLALAAPAVVPGRVAVTVTRVGEVDLAALAGNPLNTRNLAYGARAPMPLRYPNGQKPTPLLRRSEGSPVFVQTATDARAKAGGFTGSYDGQLPGVLNYELEPPDQGLAVYGGEVFEIVNNVLQIFKRDGTSVLGPISNYSLFGLTETNAPVLSDPHVLFDPTTQRWFVDELIGLSNGFYGFAVAVSETSDPTGKYYVYQIDDQGANISGCDGSCLPDYPQPGFDANAYYIDADLFSNVTGGFVDAGLYAMPKAALIAGQSFTYDYYVLPEFVLEPEVPAIPGGFSTEAGGTEYFMSARNILYGNTDLSVWAISNTSMIGTSTPPTAYNVVRKAEAYTGTVGATEPNDVGPYGQSVGATTSPFLDGGYNAFGSGVKYLNGDLYAALTTGSTDGNGLARNQVAWFKVGVKATGSSVDARILKQGYVVPPNGYSFQYPSFAVDAEGKGVIALSLCANTTSLVGAYPSTGYVNFNAGKPAASVTITGMGAASDDGFTGYNGAGPAVTGRWGDYGAATLDPVSNTFWFANEYIPDASVYPRGSYANWGTFITQAR